MLRSQKFSIHAVASLGSSLHICFDINAQNGRKRDRLAMVHTENMRFSLNLSKPCYSFV